MKVFYKTVICALAAGVILGAGFSGIRYYKNKKNISVAVTRFERLRAEYLNASDVYEKPEGTDLYDVNSAAKCAMPALVTINVKSITESFDLFGRSYGYENSGTGSGIISAQNNGEILIATNNHVVDGATSVSVIFIDGSSVNAEVKATDPTADLAVVSVKISDISVETLAKIRIATFGDSDSVAPGEMVIAIGNALGYGQSVTVGYVSALNREVSFNDHTMYLIQTDVAINPGNSGGALLNSKGEVIGINNAKVASTNVEGICYAIPASTAIPVIEFLMRMEVLPEDEQAYLGIVGQVIDKDASSLYKMPRGIYIKEVKEDSPAERAGLVAGMVITKINGISVNSQESYEKMLSCTKGDSAGTITVEQRVDGVFAEKNIDIVFGTRK